MQRVDRLGPLSDQQIARAMHDEDGLLLLGLDRHETHGGTRWDALRLRDRFSIGRIVLATLDVGLDVVHQWCAVAHASMPIRHDGNFAKNVIIWARRSFWRRTTRPSGPMP